MHHLIPRTGDAPREECRRLLVLLLRAHQGAEPQQRHDAEGLISRRSVYRFARLPASRCRCVVTREARHIDLPHERDFGATPAARDREVGMNWKTEHCASL
jgi:hypothetical protein